MIGNKIISSRLLTSYQMECSTLGEIHAPSFAQSQGIPLASVDENFVVQMNGGCVPGFTGVAKTHALGNAFACSDRFCNGG